MTPSSVDLREAWLRRVAAGLAPRFTALGAPLPERCRIAIGFTSNGSRGRRIGECWSQAASADGHFEIFIRPDLAELATAGMDRLVAAILAHELVHAAVGIDAGHGPQFRRVAKGLGLVGKMTATVAGPAFDAAIAPILEAAGPLPHAALNTRLVVDPGTGDGGRVTTAPRKQPPRMVRCVCDTCGYTVRTARHWLKTKGPPLCPTDGTMREG